MITVRNSAQRGTTRLDWLESRHSFSFGDYIDPAHMGFGTLRVINDDLVAPGRGFGMHGHRDMEIVTVVYEGALEHQDSLGNSSVIRAGEVQRMTAGTGIRHSEFNPSDSETVRLLQIWIEPERRGLKPGYEQRAIAASSANGGLRLLASPDGREGSLKIHQDARIYSATLAEGKSLRHELAPGRSAWLQVVRGSLDLNGTELRSGDGATIEDETALTLSAKAEGAEILLFDLK